MYLSSETKHTIVSVTCGDTQGTAFLVAPGYFLTARHVVINNLYNGTPIFITYKGVQYIADKAENIAAGIDLAVILAMNYAPALVLNLNNYLLPLVAVPKSHLVGEIYTIIGFPNEIGNGIDQVALEIKGEMTVSNKSYEIVTSRVGNFNFSRYDGLSGSPIINGRNAIIGIAVVEVGNKLAFVSIDSIKKELKPFLIPVVLQYLKYDTSTAGRARCWNLFEETVKLAGKRYHEDLHIQNKAFEKAVHDFIAEKVLSSRSKRIKAIETNILNNISSLNYNGHTYQEGDYDNLLVASEYWAKDVSNNSNKQLLTKAIVSLKVVYEQYAYSHAQFMYVTGTAGSGKTHLTCELAKSLLEKVNVYLFFGSQFMATESAFGQLLEKLHLDIDGLQKLNAASSGKYSLIIIDALNEGAGERYWQSELPRLIDELKSYANVKLLVTIREPFDAAILSELQRDRYPSYEISGFSYVAEQKAVDIFFKEYGVDAKYANRYKTEFKNPLFLLIFCAAYRNMNPEDRDNINYVRLFDLYLKVCNNVISEKVDEDVSRNITANAMKTIAKAVVRDNHAGLISRSNARAITDIICPNRMWSHHLLKALIDEDLLMSTLTDDGAYDALMFGYEKMGDFLKADSLVSSDISDEDLFKILFEIESYYSQNDTLNRSKFDNMVAALIALWTVPKRQKSLPTYAEFSHILFGKNIQAALKYDTEANVKEIRAWMNRSKNLFDAHKALYSATSISESKVLAWHQNMLEMTITVRDDKWTVSVNRLFNDQKQYSIIQSKTNEPLIDERLLIVITWMLSTSYPQAHHFLSKVLMEQFKFDYSHIKRLLDLFGKVDDPYVHHGLLEAIYGFVLMCRDVDSLNSIAKDIYYTYFGKKQRAPKDLLMRYWGLKILERVNALAPSVYWQAAQPPYKSDLQKTAKNITREDFGKSVGISRIYFTLSSDSDFYRYVLRSNNYSVVRDFMLVDDNDITSEIKISEIADRLKTIILAKYKLKANADLFDQEKLSGNDRMNNYKERIGKKYIWLALYEVYAELCDNGVMHYPGKSFNDGFASVNYPWYSNILPNVDPTLVCDDKNKKLEVPHFILPSDSNSMIPLVEIVDKDGNAWVQVVGFDFRTTTVKERTAKVTVYSNGLFVPESKDIDIWAESFDFTGRRMPEPEDHWRCIWNEYPWSDTYIRNVESKYYDTRLVPYDFRPSYVNILQEEHIGVMGVFESSNSYAPCVDMMRFLKLYTAERGVVRDSEGNIMALNRNLYIDGNEGLFVRKDYLLRYMKSNKLSLYLCVLSTGFYDQNKVDTTNNILSDMSGCWRLLPNGLWDILQEMNIPQK